jgi:hypothetical protein
MQQPLNYNLIQGPHQLLLKLYILEAVTWAKVNVSQDWDSGSLLYGAIGINCISQSCSVEDSSSLLLFAAWREACTTQ